MKKCDCLNDGEDKFYDFHMKQAVGSLRVCKLCAIVIKTLKEFFVMAKAARKIILACEECLARNYTTNGSKNNTKRLELKKFCPKCGKMTLHKETK